MHLTLRSKVALNCLVVLDSIVRGAIRLFGTVVSETRGALKYFVALDSVVGGVSLLRN